MKCTRPYRSLILRSALWRKTQRTLRASWRDVVPHIKEGAESVRGALEDLKKALGYLS
jgi:hypothetical protein